MTVQIGCDLRKECGFYCRFAKSLDEIWQTVIISYCDGPDFLLCARRSYFILRGHCAPADVTPIGTLPKDL